MFLNLNRVKHIRCAPDHPSMNCLAECFVRTFKEAMRAGEKDGLTVQYRLENFLLMYSVATHATMGVSPSTGL